MKNKPSGGLALIIAGGKPNAHDAGKMGGLDCIPSATLAMPDEQEQMQAPEPGDKVQYTVEGTVDHVEGDNTYIKRESINGQPVGPEDHEPETPPDQTNNQSGPGPGADNGDDQDLSDLKDMAGKTQMY